MVKSNPTIGHAISAIMFQYVHRTKIILGDEYIDFETANYVLTYFPFGFEGRIWDLIVLVSDYCLSFYFAITYTVIRTKCCLK